MHQIILTLPIPMLASMASTECGSTNCMANEKQGHCAIQHSTYVMA